MTFGLDDSGEMVEWTVPTWENEQAFTSSAWKLDNLKWTGEWTTAVQPADRSREGSAIFEIKAPPGKVLTRVTADVGGSMNNTGEQVPEDRIDVFGSAGNPTDFRLLGIVQAPPYGEHWTRRLAVKMALGRGQPVRRAYLKVRMFSKLRAALSDMRIRYFTKDEQIRLEAIGVLARRGDGRELMRKALEIETEPAVRGTLRDTLAAQARAYAMRSQSGPTSQASR
jgi:hypothetical protein